MTRIGPVHWKKFESFLIANGCEFKRQKGSHKIYWKKGLKRPIIIPRDTQLPPMVILNNLNTLGVSREDFLSFLKEKKKNKRS